MFFFFQAEDGIRDVAVTGVQTCALPICPWIVSRTILGRQHRRGISLFPEKHRRLSAVAPPAETCGLRERMIHSSISFTSEQEIPRLCWRPRIVRETILGHAASWR